MRMHNKTLKARIAALPLPRAGGAALRPPLHLPPYGGGGMRVTVLSRLCPISTWEYCTMVAYTYPTGGGAEARHM